MVEIKLDNREWWIVDDGEKALGFESLSDLKEHFKHSLKIDKNKKVEVIDDDKYLDDVLMGIYVNGKLYK